MPLNKRRIALLPNVLLNWFIWILWDPLALKVLEVKDIFFLTVDDSTRFSWVNFLREKSDMFEAFQALVHKIQNEQGVSIGRIIRIRIDHGREFENSSFSGFF